MTFSDKASRRKGLRHLRRLQIQVSLALALGAAVCAFVAAKSSSDELAGAEHEAARAVLQAAHDAIGDPADVVLPLIDQPRALERRLYSFIASRPLLAEAAVYRSDGDSTSTVAGTGETPAPSASDLRPALNRGEPAWREVSTDANHVATLTIPVEGRDGSTVAFELAYDLAPLHQSIAERNGRFAIVLTVMVLVFSGFVALLLGRRVFRPLARIGAATRRMKEGGLGERLDWRRRDELGVLADDFDAMAAEIEAQHARLEAMSFRDSLTGAASRAGFLRSLRQAILRLGEGSGQVAVLFLDLDRFKVVNDSLGHAAGDELLCAVARRLSSRIREPSVVSRFAGDEFAILVEEVSGRAEASAVAQRICDAFTEPFRIAGTDIFSSVSIGVALARDPGHAAEDLLRDADAAMYRSKESGVGCYQLFDEPTRTDAVRRLDREGALRSALADGQFRVFYQPEFGVRSGRAVAVEALVRWEVPGLGIVRPAEFIGLAEETGLIVPIDRWVLGEACRQLERWRTAHLDASMPLMRVNMSARQLADPEIAKRVGEILEQTGVEPGELCLEITETALMADGDASCEGMCALRKLGVGLAIDDFGTGQSSLAYLKRFPADHLKIDRSFVSGIDDDPTDAAIVSAVIELAHKLGMRTTGEGVENERQLAELRERGCDSVQGYLFAPPGPAESIERLLFGSPEVREPRAAPPAPVSGRHNGHHDYRVEPVG